MTYFEQKEKTDKELTELSVSGNTLLDTFNTDIGNKIDTVSVTTIEEFNKTLLSTNQLLAYLFVLMLIILIAMICSFIGGIIRNMLHHID